MIKLKNLFLILCMALPMTAFAMGAIAVDDEEGDEEPGYGIYTGASSEKEAKAGAMKECKASGNTGCKIAGWFKTCGAYVYTKKNYGYGYGDTKAKAIAAAKEQCGSNACKVLVAECE